MFYYIFICRYKGCSHDTSNDSIELISVSVSSMLDIPVLSTPPLYCWDTVYCKIINNNNVTLGTGVKYFGNITGKSEEEERGRADFCFVHFRLFIAYYKYTQCSSGCCTVYRLYWYRSLQKYLCTLTHPSL